MIIELSNRYSKINDYLGAGIGTVQGAISGASIGGPVGAIAGGVASGVGGLLDISMKENLRNEALDLRYDMFNYSLDNIKALPYTISKVSSFDANNKIFPILEYYTCTEEEKEIFRNKMKYNGMTVMRIDKIINFLNGEEQFLKGRIIRLDSLSDDYHMASVIAEEIYKGVYIK